MSIPKLLVRLFLAAVAAYFFLRPAFAFGATACVAGDFGCAAPPATCVITGSWDVPHTCEFDFGTQDVEIHGTLKSDVLGGAFSIVAGDLTLDGGKLRSPGDTDDSGGDITVEISGHFEMLASAQIDTGGNGGGGSIDIEAASISILSGNLLADGGAGFDNCGDAGSVDFLASSGPIVIDGNLTTIKATTPGYHCSGGAVTIEGPSIDVLRGIDVSGGAPDGIYITATGGALNVTAPAGLTANARGSEEESGNFAGEIELIAEVGGATIDSGLTARGSGPDGDGGAITVDAAGPVVVSRLVDAGAGGNSTSGGDIAIHGGASVSIEHRLLSKTSTFSSGGTIDVSSNGAVTFASGYESSTDGGEGGAGDISIATFGPVTLDGDLSARGSNGGDGGGVYIEGCQLSVSGDIDAGAAGGGAAYGVDFRGATLDITASASVDATPCASPDCIFIRLKSGTANIDPGADLDPAPNEDTIPGLAPCCGNGILDDGTGGTASVGEQCDDTNLSHCDGCTPTCTLEPSPPCADDGNECTLDCNPATGCAYLSQTGIACSDEPDACTNDVCQAGTCTHVPINCSDGFACTTDTCDSVTGCEHTPDDAACDDSESCTTDTCVVGQGCVLAPEPDDSPCDDGSVCTVDDSCQAGVCTGPALNCDDGDVCTLNNCHPGLGCLNSEDAAACDCLDEGGLPLDAGTSCVDGFGCTVGDTCDGAGTCVAGPECPDVDGNPCTREGCAFGICFSVDDGCDDCIEGQPCSDGDTCTTGTCTGGVCVSNAIDCDDGDACTQDVCYNNLGCWTQSFGAPGCSGDPVLDHFTCYKAKKAPGAVSVFSPVLGVSIEDEFWATTVDVKAVRALCAPTSVDGGDPTASSHEDHFEAYKIKKVSGLPTFEKVRNIQVTNQFGTIEVDTRAQDKLLVPTSRSDSGTPAPPSLPNPNSFECYRVRTSKGAPKFQPLEGVLVEDAFGTLSIDVRKPSTLCNPANVGGADPDAPDHADHLLCYKVKVTKATPAFVRPPSFFTANAFGDEHLDAIRPQELCLPSTVVVGP